MGSVWILKGLPQSGEETTIWPKPPMCMFVAAASVSASTLAGSPVPRPHRTFVTPLEVMEDDDEVGGELRRSSA